MTKTERYAGGAPEWDAEYAAGLHDRYDGLSESARLGIVSAYAAKMAAGGAGLDMGAGAAVLAPLLSGAQAPARYLAVDFSQVAIDRGVEKLGSLQNGPAQAEARCDSLENFTAGDERFDLIIFNEVLFFIEDAAAEVERYRRYLKPGGAVVISLHLPNRPESGAHQKFEKLWRALDPKWKTLDDVALESRTKKNLWRLRLIQPTAD